MQRNYSYTFVELMDDRNSGSPAFNCHDLGEGMLFFAHGKKGIGFCYLINTETENTNSPSRLTSRNCKEKASFFFCSSRVYP